MNRERMISLLLWISRILFGLVFVFSGFVKAVDPLGSTYKFQDYFLAFETPWMMSLALPLAILLSTLEFVIGMAVLLGVKMRISALAGLAFMLFFTPLTLYIAIYNPVSDCGCFGDALKISNWATFYKNIFILAAAILIYFYRKSVKPLWSIKGDWALVALFTLLITSLSVYCLQNLPILDFRPWKVGNNVNELLLATPEVAEIELVYRNKETGEVNVYPAHDYPWNDPDWLAAWEFVEQKRTIISPYQAPPISNFSIQDEYGDDYTEYFLTSPAYVFLVVAYDLNATYASAFSKINAFALEAETHGMEIIALTGSPFGLIDMFRHEHQAAFPFYQTDGVALKTIIRSNPGIVLLKDGVVQAKWHHRNLPNFETVKQKYLTDH